MGLHNNNSWRHYFPPLDTSSLCNAHSSSLRTRAFLWQAKSWRFYKRQALRMRNEYATPVNQKYRHSYWPIINQSGQLQSKNEQCPGCDGCHDFEHLCAGSRVPRFDARYPCNCPDFMMSKSSFDNLQFWLIPCLKAFCHFRVPPEERP